MTPLTQQIKVLFITSLLDRMGGAEKNLCEVVLHLNKDEFTPFVLAFKGGELTQYLADQEINVHENGIKKLFSLHTIMKAFDLYRFIRKERIDVVVTYHHDADIFGSVVAKLAGVPRVVSSRRDMGYQLQKKHVLFYRWFGFLFTHFITVSDAVKHEIMRRELVKKEKITTIHNGLDLELFSLCEQEKKKELQKELGLSAEKVSIGMVASFRPIKGQMYLVDAVASIKEWHDEVQIIVVGYNDTDYFREVQARVKEMKLEKNFIFTGDRDDVPELLQLFDLFVISSVNEGFSNAIIEAMAAGLPVITANSGGNGEAVLHGETGLLFEPCNSNALAESLTLLLSDKQMITRFGENGRARVTEKFGLNQMISANEVVYNTSS